MVTNTDGVSASYALTEEGESRVLAARQYQMTVNTRSHLRDISGWEVKRCLWNDVSPSRSGYRPAGIKSGLIIDERTEVVCLCCRGCPDEFRLILLSIGVPFACINMKIADVPSYCGIYTEVVIYPFCGAMCLPSQSERKDFEVKGGCMGVLDIV